MYECMSIYIYNSVYLYKNIFISAIITEVVFTYHGTLCVCFTSMSTYLLPRWFSGKESACQYRRCRIPDSNPGLGRCLMRRWQATLVFLPQKSHGQRSLESQKVRPNWADKSTTHIYPRRENVFAWSPAQMYNARDSIESVIFKLWLSKSCIYSIWESLLRSKLFLQLGLASWSSILLTELSSMQRVKKAETRVGLLLW